MPYLFGYIASLFSFLALDMLWMLVIARSFYRNNIGHMLRDDIKLVPAFLFYIVYIAIMIYLTVKPSLMDNAGVKQVIISSMLLGFAAYGTYDATNYSILKGWPLSVTIIDVIWGGFVTACAGAVAYFVIYSMR